VREREAVNRRHVLRMLGQPAAHVLAEQFDHFERTRIVIVERIVSAAILEFCRRIRALAAQIVYTRRIAREA
jgi:hypothetical protein